MSSGMPSSIVGIPPAPGTLAIVSCAVRGSISTVARMTTVPRSNGPAIAGTTMLSPKGASLRRGPSDRPCSSAGPARAGRTDPRPGRRRPSSCRLPTPAGMSPSDACGSGHARDVLQDPHSPAGSLTREGAEALFAVLPRERHRERAGRARLVVRRARRERRVERSARARAAVRPRVDLEVRGLRHGGRAAPRRQRALTRRRRSRRGHEQRPRPAVEAQLQFAERQLRDVSRT